MTPRSWIVLAVARFSQHERVSGSIRANRPAVFIVVFDFEQPSAEFVHQPQRAAVIWEISNPGTDGRESAIERAEGRGITRDDEKFAGIEKRAGGECEVDIAGQPMPGE